MPSPTDANCTLPKEQAKNSMAWRIVYSQRCVRRYGLRLNKWLTTGPYTGGIFKFTVMFPPHYPSVPPKLRFTSEVYHPLITDHGDFSLRPMGKWIPSQIHITNVLYFVKHSFKKKGLESLREAWCVNADAFKLYAPYPLSPQNIL